MNNLRLNLPFLPSFVSSKTKNNFQFFANQNNAEILISCIYYGRKENWYKLISFVVMPDHLHLIIIPECKNISQAMHSIKGYSGKEINRNNCRSGDVWQISFRDFTISSEDVLLEKINYIHNNPVRKGMVKGAEEYQYSSANPIYETDLHKIL